MTEAELGVLGCVLVDNKSIHLVDNILRPEMFESEFCQECFQVMIAMSDRGENINAVSVASEMESRKYDTQTVGAAIKDIVTAAPLTTMMQSYANVVAHEYQSRMVRKIFSHADLKPAVIESTIGEILTDLEDLQQNRKTAGRSMKEIVAEYSGNYFCDNKPVYIRTGLRRLDDAVILEPGDVTVIGARPGVGKSALAEQIVEYNASAGKSVAYFNLEMSDSQLYERILAAKSGIDMTRIRRAKAFLKDEQERFQKSNEQISALPVVTYTGSATVKDIRHVCRYQKYDLIVIDYLQLVRSGVRTGSRIEEVGEVSRGIKAIARDLKTHVILLSQLNRRSAYSSENEPDMAELREAGDIEQDASNIILLWNISDNFPEVKGAKVAKQRQGESIREALNYDGPHMTFTEYKKDLETATLEIKEKESSRFKRATAKDGVPEGWRL